MENTADTTRIAESFLEHRQSFANSWIDRWTTPNPFVSLLNERLKNVGVDLADFSFNKDATSVGDTFLNIAIRKLNAAVRVGLDSVTFSASNPEWGAASQLISVFDQVGKDVQEVVKAAPAFQETTLALHVISKTVDFGTKTASLVRKELLGEFSFCGISLHREMGTVVIDKSGRYEHAAFVRLQRRFSGEDSLVHIASSLYGDEVFALRLLGLIDETGEAR